MAIATQEIDRVNEEAHKSATEFLRTLGVQDAKVEYLYKARRIKGVRFDIRLEFDQRGRLRAS